MFVKFFKKSNLTCGKLEYLIEILLMLIFADFLLFFDLLFMDLQLYLKRPKNLLTPGYQFY